MTTRILISLLVVGAIIAGAVFFSVSRPPATPPDIEMLLRTGREAHDAGDYQKAIDIYTTIIDGAPEDIRPYIQIAHTYRYWGRYAESEAWFLKAAAIAPEDPWIWTDLGKLYRNMGRYEDAERTFLKSIAINPSHEESYGYGLGYLYLEQRRFSESEAMFKKALEINPRSDLALSGLGDLYREMGEFERSESFFRKAFEVNPKSEAYLGLAWLYIKQERFDEAVVPLEGFLKNIREKGEVYYTLGVAHRGAGRETEARAAFERAIELNPDNDSFRNALESPKP